LSCQLQRFHDLIDAIAIRHATATHGLAVNCVRILRGIAIDF
jgi:hypothetical protein